MLRNKRPSATDPPMPPSILVSMSMKRVRFAASDYEPNPPSQEESFLARPEIRIPVPDHVKAILVDDWENVTKNLQLVELPADIPANVILDEYHDQEAVKRREGSAEIDLLLEVTDGLKEYFNKALGRILLYRFERDQYAKWFKRWQTGSGDEWEGKNAGDVYGAEHLARLIGKSFSLLPFGETMYRLNLKSAR